MDKECLKCGAVFNTNKPFKKFCKGACQTSYYRQAAKEVTPTELREVFKYDPDTGLLYTIEGNEWVLAPTSEKEGYVITYYKGKRHMVHRLAWVLMTGEFPKKDQIDHKNRIRNDNRWENLREATRKENSRNKATYSSNSTGYKGVTKTPRGNFRALVSYLNEEGENICLVKTCNTALEAAFAYNKMASEAFGEFACLNDLTGLSEPQSYATERLHPRNTTGYKGVYYVSTTDSWTARLWDGTRMVTLGTFKTKEDAAIAYNRAVLMYLGPSKLKLLNKLKSGRTDRKGGNRIIPRR